MARVLENFSDEQQQALAACELRLMTRDIEAHPDDRRNRVRKKTRDGYRAKLKALTVFEVEADGVRESVRASALEKALASVSRTTDAFKCLVEVASVEPWAGALKVRPSVLEPVRRTVTLEVGGASPARLKKSDADLVVDAVTRMASAVKNTKLKVAGATAVAGGAMLLTAGIAAPAIGAAVAGPMAGLGLSGAAASSAGLAFLGGGSLASGGLGMAGGTALIMALGAGAGATAGAGVGSALTSLSRNEFDTELTKLGALTYCLKRRTDTRGDAEELMAMLQSRAGNSEPDDDGEANEREDNRRLRAMRRVLRAL